MHLVLVRMSELRLQKLCSTNVYTQQFVLIELHFLSEYYFEAKTKSTICY